MSKISAPRRGSMSVRPRKRSKRVITRVGFWNKAREGILGFVGYKAGMTHILWKCDRAGPNKDKELSMPVTIVECPPIFCYGAIAFKKTHEGLKTLTQIISTSQPKQLKKSLSLAKKSKSIEDLKKRTSEGAVSEIRLLFASQPFNSGTGNKKPHFFEVGLGGSVQNQLEIAEKFLGKEVRISDVFSEGEFVDIQGVTKGKGWQGIVKRFGVKLGKRKTTQSKRAGGSLGAFGYAKVMYTIPRAGQTGFHKRTEERKRIMVISGDAKLATPKGGFLGYGSLKSDFVLLSGSVMGAKKRAIRLIKSAESAPATKPDVKAVNTDSKQGA